jgi:hypothetical protein
MTIHESRRERLMYAVWLVMYIVGIWLMTGVGWRVPLGVFTFVWANNNAMAFRIKTLMDRIAEEAQKARDGAK